MVEFALNSHAIVDTGELRSLGLDSAAITRRLDRRRLFRLHRGVYSVIPPIHLKPEGRWLAAVKAVGSGSGLAWPQAGALWELQRNPSGPIHVAIPGHGGKKKRQGVVIHRRTSLQAEEIVIHRGVPVTSERRTLLDAKHAVSEERYDDLLRKAEILQLNTGKLADLDDVDLNKFERRFFALCRHYGVPKPLKQQIIGPFTVDFLWPDAGLVVETDGWKDHGTRERFEGDRARDAWLMTRGYRVVRITWRQLQNDPAAIAATLGRLILSS